MPASVFADEAETVLPMATINADPGVQAVSLQVTVKSSTRR